MLTSFFGTAKPINFVLILLYMTLVFLAVCGPLWWQDPGLGQTMTLLFYLVMYLLSLVVLDFIAKKNKLTKKNSFNIVSYCGLTGALAPALLEYQALVALVFIGLALRRIITMKSGLDLYKKVFDASLWIGMATLFEPGCIFYFLLLFIGISMHGNGNYRLWLIPFMGVITISILALTGAVMDLWTLSLDGLSSLTPAFNFDFIQATEIQGMLIILGLLSALAILRYFKVIRERVIRQDRPNNYLVLWAVLVGLIAMIFQPENKLIHLYFVFAPLAMIIAKYLRTNKKKWITEFWLWLLLLAPLSAVIFMQA
ncbi:DUF6427 family protein [Croceiramulus getboli]|nr:DUF6427 family protein [Flavobacteriaceae bacterium YJPT1-3]